ncbi:hypothetical protein C8P63_13411 [Melghirimyces profundicolus]|uniref:YolD-like protein n=1 Tax=Melghirimyces profundicolus TaxID=1242148 RepID=A0A2T6B5D6_9BACL|nr:YolD-like family protein [Melghirimyces profundicolus]PTX51243.1 hypothetical protein C8P63_13411 [Melghirimyces profundicolus]
MGVLKCGSKRGEENRGALPEQGMPWWREQKMIEECQHQRDPATLKRLCRIIEWSKMEEQPIAVIYAHRYGPTSMIGQVVRIDLVQRWLILNNGREEVIPFSLILGAEKVPEAAGQGVDGMDGSVKTG